jgi:hypothetical protein
MKIKTSELTKIKTSELTGAALDWAVAKCQRYEAHLYIETNGKLCFQSRHWSPSTDWKQGGPIIEREKIAVRFEPECYWLFAPPEATWLANYNGVGEWHGPTPLIAAMRCYVASKLGDTVDVPQELINV